MRATIRHLRQCHTSSKRISSSKLGGVPLNFKSKIKFYGLQSQDKQLLATVERRQAALVLTDFTVCASYRNLVRCCVSQIAGIRQQNIWVQTLTNKAWKLCAQRKCNFNVALDFEYRQFLISLKSFFRSEAHTILTLAWTKQQQSWCSCC